MPAWLSPGATSPSNSIHLPISSGSMKVKPVKLPPGCDRLLIWPRPTGSMANANTTGMDSVLRFAFTLVAAVAIQFGNDGRAVGKDHIGRALDQLLCILLDQLVLAGRPAIGDVDIVA